MKTVSGKVLSSKPISLSKAASTLSSFLSTDNGASQAICAYLRRASASFNELKQLHKELRSSRSHCKYRNDKSELVGDVEGVVGNSYRSEVSQELSLRIGDGENKKSSVAEGGSGKKRREIEPNRDLTESKPTRNVRSGEENSRGYGEVGRVDGKTTMVSGGTGGFEVVGGVDGKRRSELKIKIEDSPGRKVELDKVSNDRDNSTVAFENRRKRHRKKSEDEIGEIGDNECEAGTRESDSRLRSSDTNGVGYGAGVNERKLKNETAGNRVESVELGQNLSSVIEHNVARGKDRKKHEDKKDVDDEKGQVKGEGQRRRDMEEEKSRENKGNDYGKVHVELPTKKEKKKKKKREQDVGDLQNDMGGAMEKEVGMSVLDSGSKREEGKKRKNRDVLEEAQEGSIKQSGVKRRKINE